MAACRVTSDPHAQRHTERASFAIKGQATDLHTQAQARPLPERTLPRSDRSPHSAAFFSPPTRSSMARVLFIFASSCALAASLSVGTSSIGRRAACQQAVAFAAGVATTALPTAAFAEDKNAKEQTLLRDTGKALKDLLADKAGFVAKLEAGETVTMPAAIPFTTFQKLVRAARCVHAWARAGPWVGVRRATRDMQTPSDAQRPPPSSLCPCSSVRVHVRVRVLLVRVSRRRRQTPSSWRRRSITRRRTAGPRTL